MIHESPTILPRFCGRERALACAGTTAFAATGRGKVSLKITDVQILPVDRYLFVQIATNEGITGLGESAPGGSWKLRREPWKRSNAI